MTRFGIWRAGVWLAASMAAALALVWAVSQATTRGGALAAAPMLAFGALVAAASLRAAARLADSRAFDLRWDGRAWYLGRPAAPATDPIVGEVQVAIDAGSWLLLRFDSAWPAPERRRYWLPLQRRGLEPAWHALRCAIYSPRSFSPRPSSPRPAAPLLPPDGAG